MNNLQEQMKNQMAILQTQMGIMQDQMDNLQILMLKMPAGERKKPTSAMLAQPTQKKLIGEPTQEYLNEMFAYNRETGIVTRKITRGTTAQKGDTVGTSSKTDNGMMYTTLSKKRYGLRKIIVLMETGKMPMFVKSNNGITSDNKWDNLDPIFS